MAEDSMGLALGIMTVDSSLSATFLDQRKHCVDRWRYDPNEAAHFLDGGDECINLQRSASFEILQHRHLVTDGSTSHVQSPRHHLFRNGETERYCYRLSFGHHGIAQSAKAGLGG